MKAVREVLNKADTSMHAEEGQVSPSEQWANAMTGPCGWMLMETQLSCALEVHCSIDCGHESIWNCCSLGARFTSHLLPIYKACIYRYTEIIPGIYMRHNTGKF
jgi:hypothetical protein